MPRRVVAAAIQLGHNAGMLVAAEVGSFEAPGRVGPGAWCAVHESVLLWLRGCPYATCHHLLPRSAAAATARPS
jgi:hypothetical protein